jgi:hypothetical protein
MRDWAGSETMASKEFLKKFMKARFPREAEGSIYWEEWDERLKHGDPRVYMDDITLKVFKKIKKQMGIA